MRLDVIGMVCLSLLGSKNLSQAQIAYPYHAEFDLAYTLHPEVPRGILEAVSHTQTRLVNLTGNEDPSCVGLPKVYGVMGLVQDGQGYFDNNLVSMQQATNFSLAQVKTDPASNIAAYATAFEMEVSRYAPNDWSGIEATLAALSEIPMDLNPVNDFARSAFTYQVLSFLRDEENQAKYGFPQHDIDLESIYGAENLRLLASKKVEISTSGIQDSDGNQYRSQGKSFDYSPALWVATPSCNYSSRNGTPISAVTIHTIQGTYAGAISWAQNCNANVSYHYVVRSTDGQVTQMVYEADKAWHVGSENPYTIGIEHEGYVSDPAWTTTPLYNGSAGIVKDVTQSGYGIDPLRTYHGVATTGINVLGGCTRIKGHQHYPNQSHTDPGIYWDWEYYYQLINDNPSITNLNTSTGTFYDSGGPTGNYTDDERELYLIQPANVQSITISFVEFSLETNWDYLYIYDGASTQDPLLGVFTGSTIPSDITSSGGSVLIEFRSDCSTQDSGWEITWTSVSGPVPGDVIPPTTQVAVTGNWQTTDFTASFSDADNSGGSGVEYSLYQVIDFNGTEWRANASNGFFSDNFDLGLHPDWTNQVGTWAINSAVLEQADELNANTNLWADLEQGNHDVWLYHFGLKVDGSGGNRRAGFHFMCDDPSLINRGNSYFIWLRADDNKLQIYKTVANVFQLEVDIPFTVNAGQWYDVKTLYDKTTGEIQLFINNVLGASWTDPSPYTSGNSISFRSGDCIMQVNNLKVYHERGATELVTLNTGNDIRYQNPDPLTPSAKVKSIAIDSAANVSTITDQLVNVDWTPPSSIGSINDGVGADISSFTNNTAIEANWSTSSDPNSDIAKYWYSIGTAPLAADVVGWTDNWIGDTIQHPGLNLVQGTTYFTCVYAENGAGLFSDTICSDGQTLVPPTAAPIAGFATTSTNICLGEGVQVQNSSVDAQTYAWSAPGATPSTSTDANPTFFYPTSGSYDITLTATGAGGTDTDVQTIFVEVDSVPVAAFTPSALQIGLSNALVTFSNSSTHANGYLWDFGDGNISTDVNPWHQYLATGSFSVQLVAVNGVCPNDTAFQIIEVVDDLGLSESALQGLVIFPNPVSDGIGISLDRGWGQDLMVRLYDGSGRLVQSDTHNGGHMVTIELRKNITNGEYILQLTDGNRVASHRILVKRD